MEMDSSRKKHRLWMVIGVFAWIVIIAFVGIRMFAASKISPTLRKQVSKFHTTKVSLPRDWHKPADVAPPDVLAFHHIFGKKMERVRKKYERLLSDTGTSTYGILEKWDGENLTNEERSSFSLLMTELQPIIDETSRSVRLPRYTLATDMDATKVVDFLQLQTFAKLMPIVALEQARTGKCINAMETAALPLRTIRRPEQAYMITHLIGVALTSISATSFNNLLHNCTDTSAIRRGLELLNELRPAVFPGEIEYWYYEELAALRFAAAYGYPVDISPQSQATIILQRYQLWQKGYYEWLIDNLPSGDRKVAVAKERIADINRRKRNSTPFNFGFHPDASSFAQGLVRMLIGVEPVLLFHAGMSPNFKVAFIRSYAARARYDLTRLNYVRRLVEADSSATTLTAYLDTLPEDPFTSAPFLFSSTRHTNYSVGPDSTDDKAVVIYDATNGTVSVGDIFMESR